jgi:NAD+ synthase (glutamine-hydrolysing)
LAAETCEELFTVNAPRIDLAFSGVEVFMNASGSHHQLRKLNLRIDSIRNATRLCGGVYMYANQQGCDGGRLYYGMSKCWCSTMMFFLASYVFKKFKLHKWNWDFL